MSGSRTSVTILANRQQLVVTAVTIAGRDWPVYTDAAMATAVTLPATVTSDVTWYGPDESGDLVLTVAQADGTDVSVRAQIAPGAPQTVAPLPTFTGLAADVGRVEWQDLRVSLGRAATGAANPSFTVLRDGVRAYQFSATTDQQLFFDVQLPHGFVGGVNRPASTVVGAVGELRPHLHWTVGNSTSTGSVLWGMEYTWSNAVNPPGNVFGTSSTLTASQAASGTPYAHQIVAFDAIDCTEMWDSAILMCRLFRDADNIADTAPAVFALSFDLHYQTAHFGSTTEYGTAAGDDPT